MQIIELLDYYNITSFKLRLKLDDFKCFIAPNDIKNYFSWFKISVFEFNQIINKYKIDKNDAKFYDKTIILFYNI